MIIKCWECNTSFSLDDHLVKESGTRVRCSKCKRIFTAYPDGTREDREKPGKGGASVTDSVIGNKAVSSDLNLPDFDDILTEEEKSQNLDGSLEDHLDDPGDFDERLTDDELDLSDLEDMIEEDEEIFKKGREVDAMADLTDFGSSSDDAVPVTAPLIQEMPPDTDGVVDDNDDELDLGDLEEMVQEEIQVSEDEIEGLDELDMDLDFELDGPDNASEEVLTDIEKTDNLDMSEIDSLIENDEELSTEDFEGDDLDLDLDLDLDTDADAIVSDFESGSKESDIAEVDDKEVDSVLDDDQVDLLDLESMIDEEVERIEQDETRRMGEIDLDLGSEDENGQYQEDDMVVSIPDDDLDVEFEIEEDEQIQEDEEIDPEEPFEDRHEESIPLDDEPSIAIDEGPGEEATEARRDHRVVLPGAPTRKSSVPLLLLLLLAILAGLFFGAPYLEKQFGIKIPYLSGQSAKESDPLGKNQFKTQGIDSWVINSAKSGQMYIVSGKVKSSYPQQRKMIKMKGKLFAKNKKLISTQEVYAGNTLANIDLESQTKDEILKSLKTATGVNSTIKPNETIPFMIVFFDFSEEAQEFSVEVASSVEAK